MKKNLKVCPKCKLIYSEPSAISRRDNKTEICSQCGVKEAIEDWCANNPIKIKEG